MCYGKTLLFTCNQIQRVVISGGSFKPDTLKPKEVVSLLLDDDELEKKREFSVYVYKSLKTPPAARMEAWCLFPAVRQRQEEKRQLEESSKVKERKRKREKYAEKVPETSSHTGGSTNIRDDEK